VRFASDFAWWIIPPITVLLVAAIVTGAWKSAGWLVLDLVSALIFYRLFRGDR
jgi:hypothetical protein